MTKTRDEVVEIMAQAYLDADSDCNEWSLIGMQAAYDALIEAGVIPQPNPYMTGYVMRCHECKEFHARLSCPTPPQAGSKK